MRSFLTDSILLLSCVIGSSRAWLPSFQPTTPYNEDSSCRSSRYHDTLTSAESNSLTLSSRRTLISFIPSLLLLTSLPAPSNALVKGNAPPTKSKVTDKPKCTNIEECQAQAEAREKAEREEAEANTLPPSVSSGGTRYRDMYEGDGEEIQEGDEVRLYYKVLKLGKRSFDGLSGEGTVVFSRGYGLEDDESKPGDKYFTTTVGSLSNIIALNEAVPGMKVGGIRRFTVLPQKGWRKAGQACDGGPGGSGAGGDLKTDYIVVPTATMVAEEACFDQSKQPFPNTFGQQRRMAQRFDQSLIVELQVVAKNPSVSF
jgi:FKBP-type peptidyl-prolyl cis-trans isomerase